MRPGKLVLVVALALGCAVPLVGQQKQKPKWTPSPHIAATDPLRPDEQIKKIKLPPGFELQLVAADPDIRKPININFDAAGRLWLTETIEYPYPAKPGQGRDAVKILEDFGPDGKARKITTFADKLNIPIGVIPTEKGALVYSIPAITHLSDTKGTGKADLRETYYSGFGANDTHGMTGEFMQGFDGWIYACHGYANTSNVKSKDGKSSITMTSGNTYRIKPDGSRVEQWTWGQVNPFGLAFDPYGNLYSGDCHSQPLTMLLRHGWYVSFNRPNDGLGFAPHMNTFGSQHSTALCGVAYYAADQYPAEYRGRLFLGDVVNNRINSYQIDWNGASPKAVLKEFLTSSDPWFRPVDIKLGPDGCLYFADFYNRIIGHYEVPLNHPGRDRDKGRIWRIVYRGKPGEPTGVSRRLGPQPVTNLATADVKTLVHALGSPNLTVRLLATNQLVERGGKEAAAALQPIAKDIAQPGDGARKAHALWVLERLGKLDDDVLAAASSASEKEVRVHAQRILEEKARWTPKYAALAKLGLEDKAPFVQRVAVEALAAHPSADQIQPIAALAQKVPAADTHLTYAIRVALREQMRGDKTWPTLKIAAWPAQEQRAVADACLGMQSPAAAEFLKGYLTRADVSLAATRDYLHHVVRRGDVHAITWALALLQKQSANNLGGQGFLLKAVVQAAQERGANLSKEERASAESIIVRMLEAPQADTLKAGVELAETMRLMKTQPRLLALIAAPLQDQAVTKACVKALVTIDAKKAGATFTRMILDEKVNLDRRKQIARFLGATNHPEAQSALLKALETAPARLEPDIALGLTGSKAGCERLLQAIEKGKAPVSALASRPVALNFQNAKVNLGKLGKGFASTNVKTQELIAKRRDAFASFQGDAIVGQKVFQKNCAICHQIANQGAKVGPNLDGIGTRGLERLLEDVLDPNRNVDQAFRTTVITTKAGQSFSGLFLREEGNVVILGDKEGKDVRIEKGQIDERVLSPLSPMPSNFLESISEPEMQHLMAYLLSQRGKM